jgi:hypothetical protein
MALISALKNAQIMAQIFTLPIAIEYRPRTVRWTVVGDLLKPMPSRQQANNVADAWTMRGDFFQLKQGNTDGLLKFLNKWGSWQSWDSTLAEPVDQIWEKHRRFRAATRGSAIDWLTDENGVNEAWLRMFRTRTEYPYCVVTLSGCEPAMRMAITIDLLKRVKFRICARPDCRSPFPLESEHKRQFCSQYCGHLQSLRKARKEATRAKRKAKRP